MEHSSTTVLVCWQFLVPRGIYKKVSCDSSKITLRITSAKDVGIHEQVKNYFKKKAPTAVIARSTPNVCTVVCLRYLRVDLFGVSRRLLAALLGVSPALSSNYHITLIWIQNDILNFVEKGLPLLYKVFHKGSDLPSWQIAQFGLWTVSRLPPSCLNEVMGASFSYYNTVFDQVFNAFFTRCDTHSTRCRLA